VEYNSAMKAPIPLVVSAFWDGEAQVWVATSDDVPGLATEADSVEALVAKLKVMIPDLLDANGYENADEDVPFTVKTEVRAVAPRHAA